MLPQWIDFIIHFDKYLDIIIQQFGPITYLILFLIIFAETGLVITPFLPGDSLLFILGALAGKGTLNIFLLFIVLSIAAILGDSVNYFIGNFFGERVFLKKGLIKKEHLDKTKEFYEKYGGKTIILGRFLPIVRTFAPFVAGVGKMNYSKFLLYNIVGGIIWVALFLFAGYFLGSLPWVEDNLTMIIMIIIVLSIIPPIIEYIKHKRRNKIN